jgi:hypothetical protein
VGDQFKKLVWNTERCDLVIDVFVALVHAIITLRRLSAVAGPCTAGTPDPSAAQSTAVAGLS